MHSCTATIYYFCTSGKLPVSGYHESPKAMHLPALEMVSRSKGCWCCVDADPEECRVCSRQSYPSRLNQNTKLVFLIIHVIITRIHETCPISTRSDYDDCLVPRLYLTVWRPTAAYSRTRQPTFHQWADWELGLISMPIDYQGGKTARMLVSSI